MAMQAMLQIGLAAMLLAGTGCVYQPPMPQPMPLPMAAAMPPPPPQQPQQPQQQCHEFQQTVTIGGEAQQAFGTSCLQPDGTWKVVTGPSPTAAPPPPPGAAPPAMAAMPAYPYPYYPYPYPPPGYYYGPRVYGGMYFGRRW